MAGEKILVVEDEPAVARGLAYGLRAEGFDVRVAQTGSEALDLVATAHPDLVLLDIRLPDISGFDVCRRLRNDGHRLPILMLTALDEEVDRVLGLELGADDYVVKPFSLRELIARVRALLRRAYGELSAISKGEQLQFGDLLLNLELLQVFRKGDLVYLTPTEFRLLRYLATNKGRPITRAELIEAVWGYDSEIGSTRTVDVHIRHLREKLEEDPSNPKWIQTVRGIGYKFVG